MIPSIDPTHSSRLTRRRFLSAGAAWLGLASLPKSVLAGAVAQAADDFETMTGAPAPSTAARAASCACSAATAA